MQKSIFFYKEKIMLLTIDIGNTNIAIGIFEKEKLTHHWRISTNKLKTSYEYGIDFCNLFFYSNILKEQVKGIIISSVVPSLQDEIELMCNKFFNIQPLIVSPGIKTGISIKIENPKELGADRVVNAVAAFTKYKKACIVVDFGTATTFDYISEKGEYEGGLISPGLFISLGALAEKTSKLPSVDFHKPSKVVATNTVEAIQSGVFYGYIGLVKEIIKRIKLEKESNPLVIATGGISSIISKEIKEINIVDPYLTLEGLKILYEKNI